MPLNRALSALAPLARRVSRFHGQQNPRFWPPGADSLHKKFYWRTVTPIAVRLSETATCGDPPMDGGADRVEKRAV